MLILLSGFFSFAGVINLIPFTLARKAFGEAFRIR